ncbi:MAG: hypothetical protein HFG85_01740 [Dorea sp.]|jgi:hypothetical protein|uniref:hypothetical protein n=1 Tax=Sporofaciens sp. JLR.KK001 TaxID=3112621 RepID=UPI00216F9D51|nr:hypothetical protein [Dorea sp.]
MNVDFYEYNGLGYIVDPESDTKVVTVILIGKQTVKANPRPAVIYVTGGKINESYEKLEELKAYCAENKVVYICPTSTDADELGKTYQYAIDKFKDLNIVKEEISVKADSENMSAAQELVEFVLDEFDDELDDAEEFSL